MLRFLAKAAGYLILTVVLAVTAALAWLRWESGLSREAWFDERRGRIVAVESEESPTAHGQLSEFATLRSDTGLTVSLRVIRGDPDEDTLPVLIVLGGHRTGSDAVELFGDVGERAVVALDYPYDGPERVRGLLPVLRTIPAARQAFLDTPPAVSLVLDWLHDQPWVNREQLVIVGASLGVPFAATAAARDERITGVLLVHGAADNRLWLEAQVARRIDARFLHRPLGTILHWLAYGSSFKTAERIASVAPRPVLIIGARDDERTPAGQTELLFAAAGEPKKLRWTEGLHIEPGRTEIIDELLRIADEELPFD